MDSAGLRTFLGFSTLVLREENPPELYPPKLRCGVGMHTGALRARQVIDAPPTHLEQDEGDEEHPERHLAIVRGDAAVVHIDEIGKPGDGRPRLLRVPRPIVPPGLLSPKCPEEHADGHESQPHVDEVVADAELLLRALAPEVLAVALFAVHAVLAQLGEIYLSRYCHVQE